MVFKIFHVILLASVKYFVTLPYAMIIGLNYQQALISVLIGGIGGFLFFYYLSKRLITAFEIVKPRICRYIPEFVKVRFHVFCTRMSLNKPSKIFSKKSRFIAKVKSSYGFWGILLALHLFLLFRLVLSLQINIMQNGLTLCLL